jgi:outer membrane lipoprotein-sorting protein
MMKKAIFVLLFAVFSLGCVSSLAAQSNAKAQARELRKADQKRQKAMKKYAKAQKKAERKMLKTERKNTRYPHQTL